MDRDNWLVVQMQATRWLFLQPHLLASRIIILKNALLSTIVAANGAKLSILLPFSVMQNFLGLFLITLSPL